LALVFWNNWNNIGEFDGTIYLNKKNQLNWAGPNFGWNFGNNLFRPTECLIPLPQVPLTSRTTGWSVGMIL
jgi:hypothetical protein